LTNSAFLSAHYSSNTIAFITERSLQSAQLGLTAHRLAFTDRSAPSVNSDRNLLES